uniref:Saccharopine dehydrogenase NADP binding domain-containing protein n=1 Tax=Entomoneis paludosa TaxID=265537 RepID=A0A7S2YFX2_9STRA
MGPSPHKQLSTGKFAILSVSPEEEKGVVASVPPRPTKSTVFGSNLLNGSNSTAASAAVLDPLVVTLECETPGVLVNIPAAAVVAAPVPTKPTTPAQAPKPTPVVNGEADSSSSQKAQPKPANNQNQSSGKKKKQNKGQAKQSQGKNNAAPVDSPPKVLADAVPSTEAPATTGAATAKKVSTGKFALLHDPAVPIVAVPPVKKGTSPKIPFAATDFSTVSKEGVAMESGAAQFPLWAAEQQIFQQVPPPPKEAPPPQVEKEAAVVPTKKAPPPKAVEETPVVVVEEKLQEAPKSVVPPPQNDDRPKLPSRSDKAPTAPRHTTDEAAAPPETPAAEPDAAESETPTAEPAAEPEKPRERRSGRRRFKDSDGPPHRGVSRTATGDSDLLVRVPTAKVEAPTEGGPVPTQVNVEGGEPPKAPVRERRSGRRRNAGEEEDGKSGESSAARGPPTRRGVQRTATGDGELLVRGPSNRKLKAEDADSKPAAVEPDSKPVEPDQKPEAPRQRRGGRRKPGNEPSEEGSSGARGPPTRRGVQRTATGDDDMLVRAPSLKNLRQEPDAAIVPAAAETSASDSEGKKDSAPVAPRQRRGGRRRGKLSEDPDEEGGIPAPRSSSREAPARRGIHRQATGDDEMLIRVPHPHPPPSRPQEEEPKLVAPPTKMEKHILVLVSLQSLEREVVANQQNAMLILDSNKVNYKTLDGADPENKDRRNELFGISGLRAKYPQFFKVDEDGKTTFWGNWDTFEMTNENKEIAKELDGVAPVAVKEAPKSTNAAAPTRSVSPQTVSPQPEVLSDPRMLVLVSNQSLNREAVANQQKAFTILDQHSVPREVVDGSDPENKDYRNELFALSGLRGEYPQFFLVKNGQKTFWGTWDTFELANDNGDIAKLFAEPSAKPTKENAETSSAPVESKSRAVDFSAAEPPVEKSRSLDFAAAAQTKIVKGPKTDITVYGATSFVAKHVLSYLIQSSLHLPRNLKVTLAGRNEGKLTALKKKLTQQMNNLFVVNDNRHSKKIEFDTFVAESSEVDKLRAMASRTRVVLSCAGPYNKYGTQVVGACADSGTDYVDITGEVHWASRMREEFGESSKKSGARIISFCGFDSIPSDIAVFHAIEELRKEVGPDATVEKATTWHAADGMANAGTMHTVLDVPIRLFHCFARPVPFLLEDPLALTPPSVRKSKDFDSIRNRLAIAEWRNQLPASHSFLMGGFSAPFGMAVVNAKVVNASAIAKKYGPNFVYYERFLPVGFKYSAHLKGFSVIPAVVVQLGIMLGMFVLKLPIIGSWLTHTFFPIGSGMSDEGCQAGHAEVYAEVESAPDSNGKIDKANCLLKFKGDPGNWTTAQCVSESALCLLLDRRSLPTKSDDGFGTPAEILGGSLLKRLKDSRVRKVECATDVRMAADKYEWRMFNQ